MVKIINLAYRVSGIKSSIKIMDAFAQDVQNILDRDYKELKLKAIDTYIRQYIHPQLTVCVFKEDDFDAANSDKIVFAIHYQEWKSDRDGLERIIEERLNLAKREKEW